MATPRQTPPQSKPFPSRARKDFPAWVAAVEKHTDITEQKAEADSLVRDLELMNDAAGTSAGSEMRRVIDEATALVGNVAVETDPLPSLADARRRALVLEVAVSQQAVEVERQRVIAAKEIAAEFVDLDRKLTGEVLEFGKAFLAKLAVLQAHRTAFTAASGGSGFMVAPLRDITFAPRTIPVFTNDLNVFAEFATPYVNGGKQ